jgi:3'-phosphoadenosine 5'-phosphosulfate sulfotransferase (PAPS reductase)/FAD synthetase
MSHNDALEAINNGALVFVSHSGGKDAQAMYAHLRAIVPADQIIVVHANLGEVEWSGVVEHIEANIDDHKLNVVRNSYDFIELVERKFISRPDVPSWPSPQYRPCTAALKRGPIQKFIIAEMKRRGSLLAINAMGLRAEESSARAKRPVWRLNKKLSLAGRTVHDWAPIHHWTEAEVFSQITTAGQKRFHAYDKGNKRLSCMFCIMGCHGDLRNAAKANPELAQRYIDLEHKTGYTMFHNRSLEEILSEQTTPEHGDFFNTNARK